MPIIDFTGGSAYADPNRAMTIKALQARRDALAKATMQAEQPTQIGSVTQGIGGVANALVAGLRERQATQDAVNARDKMAQLLAGGLKDPVSMAQAMALDPETAMKYQEQSWEQAKVEAQNRFTQQQQQALFAHEDTAAAARVQAEKDAAAAQVEANKALETQREGAQAAQEEKRLANEQTLEKMRQQGVSEAEIQRAADAMKLEQFKSMEPTPGSVPDLERQKNAGNFGPVDASGKLVNAADQAMYDASVKKATFVSPTQFMTPAQSETDRLAAKEVQDWKTVGGPNAAKAITQVEQAIGILEKGKKGQAGGWVSPTGSWAGLTEFATPEWVQRIVNPQGKIAQDAIRETIATTLRPILGPQFTEQEGENLMNRAFSTSADMGENIRRAKLLLGNIKAITASKQAQADWLDDPKNGGTMIGYRGPQADYSTLKTLAANGFGDPVDTGTTETATSGRPNVTIEEVK